MIQKLRQFLDRLEPHFKEGKLSKAYPLYEALDTFLYAPDSVTRTTAHVRDAIDLKRLMFSVIIALQPVILMAQYNTGLQANRALAQMGLERSESFWRGAILEFLGLGYNPHSFLDNFVHGMLYFVPIFVVTQIAGGLMEVLFATLRKHEINEGFLVTGMLYPLTLPPDTPLWQVALGIIFGVVIGKEIFGGTGRNFLNPALTGRAFLFFAYPADISGNSVWVAVDGYTKATGLSVASESGLAGLAQNYNWWQSFLGFIPGSMGETSTLGCLLGAVLLVAMGIGSLRIMVSMVLGTATCITLFNVFGDPTSNPFLAVPFHWHLVLGGYAFGLVFMATDPVSASFTATGKLYYGFLIGIMVALVRVLNPAYPEGTMLAILFANSFAPLIDYFVIRSNIKRRIARHGPTS
ncbi:MAG: NADH:ubiquinone reductase (Na(+)-transporting) subunit B [Proteobacteria bacterium]|nr:NADH:ubiquinone reductase (Na(+)-transporting) subunit B [Pseudomonadota bacterium]